MQPCTPLLVLGFNASFKYHGSEWSLRLAQHSIARSACVSVYIQTLTTGMYSYFQIKTQYIVNTTYNSTVQAVGNYLKNLLIFHNSNSTSSKLIDHCLSRGIPAIIKQINSIKVSQWKKIQILQQVSKFTRQKRPCLKCQNYKDPER